MRAYDQVALVYPKGWVSGCKHKALLSNGCDNVISKLPFHVSFQTLKSSESIMIPYHVFRLSKELHINSQAGNRLICKGSKAVLKHG